MFSKCTFLQISSLFSFFCSYIKYLEPEMHLQLPGFCERLLVYWLSCLFLAVTEGHGLFLQHIYILQAISDILISLLLAFSNTNNIKLGLCSSVTAKLFFTPNWFYSLTSRQKSIFLHFVCGAVRPVYFKKRASLLCVGETEYVYGNSIWHLCRCLLVPEESWKKADIHQLSAFSRSSTTSRLSFLRMFASAVVQRASLPPASILTTTEHSSFILISRSRNRIIALEPQAEMF